MAEFKEAEERDVKLVSLDGDSFVVPLKVAKMSHLVNTMLIDDDSEEEKEIPLPNVKAATLAKVIEYCRHYMEDPMTEFEKVRNFSFLFYYFQSLTLFILFLYSL